MGYNLQTSRDAFVGGKNILASEHVQFIEGGATLTAGTDFKVGDLIAKDATGKFVKFDNLNVANYTDFGILNVDADATNFDTVVGEVIVRGSVYTQKLQGDVANFKAHVPMIRFVG